MRTRRHRFRLPTLQLEERTIWVGLGYATLFLAPPLLMLLVIAAKFQGLREVVAMDHAQLARHLASGDGFVTSVIRPLSLAFHAELRNHPDLYNGPVHPLVVALFFKGFQPTERVAAGAGATLWVISVWATFLVGRRWFGPAPAALAALFYAANIAMISGTVEALPHPTAAIAVLLEVWAAFPDPRDVRPAAEPAEPAELPAWRVVLVGVACAVAALTHHLLVTVAIVLGWHVVTISPRRGRALALFLAGFLGLLAPWALRTAFLTRSPLFNLRWYEVFINTFAAPGESIWRITAPPHHPLLFPFRHPLQFALKTLGGVMDFRREFLFVIEPVVGFLFVAALLNQAGRREWVRLLWATGAGLLLLMLGACMLRTEPALLLAWSPVLCVLAAYHLTVWVTDRIGPLAFGDRIVSRRWTRGGVYTLALTLVGVPLGYYVLVSRPGNDPRLGERVVVLEQRLRPGRPVLTNQPELVAWYARRPAIWLPQREEDLLTLEKTFDPLPASYMVSAGPRAYRPDEPGGWWFWLATVRGVYRGLELSTPVPTEGILRIRAGEDLR